MDGVLRKSDIFLATFDIFQRMNMFGCPETGGIYMALWQGWGRREKEKALIRASPKADSRFYCLAQDKVGGYPMQDIRIVRPWQWITCTWNIQLRPGTVVSGTLF